MGKKLKEVNIPDIPKIEEKDLEKYIIPSNEKPNPENMRYRTAEERYLFELMFDFEEKYFEDLTLKMYERSPMATAKRIDDSIEYLDLNQYGHNVKIRIEEPLENNNVTAQCDLKNFTITFFRGRYESSKKITLLHEMIHHYDHELVESGLRDFVLINLYDKLLRFISKKNLFEILCYETHQVFRIGASHSILFILKSLDLDIRLNKKLGTVMAYGKKKWYGNIPYKKLKKVELISFKVEL